MVKNYVENRENTIFEEILENIHFYNVITIVNIRIFRFARQNFPVKIIFERKYFVFIGNFSIRRVNIKCFSLCSGNVFNVIQRDEFILSLKGEHLRQVFGLLLGRGDF